MVIRCLLFAAACVLWGVSSPVHALWREARSGQSVAEVRQQFPDAVTAAEPETLYSGARGLLLIPSLELAGVELVALLYFLDGALTQVDLEFQGGAAERSVIKANFDKLRDALEGQYGPGIDELSDDPYLHKRSTRWRSGQTRIQLLELQLGRATPVLKIVHQHQPDSGD